MAPLSDETVIWRYMKLNSFLELLGGHLIETRIDMLQDASEGAYGWRTIRMSAELQRRLSSNGKPLAVEEAIRRARTHVAASYWFEFDRESYGMWSVYGRSGESVAIETSVGALRELLGRQGEAWVERMRYEPMEGEIGDIHTLFFHKRREYKEEQEIRSLQVFDHPLDSPIVDLPLSPEDLNGLIKRIILAPDSRKTFVDAVRTTVDAIFAMENKKFAGAICRSSLDDDLIPQ